MLIDQTRMPAEIAGPAVTPSIHRVAVVLGTRPEAIKLAPVVRALEASTTLEPVVVSTGQHREMLRTVLDTFGLEADLDLDLMRPNQTLAGMTAAALGALDRTYGDIAPDLVVVQGDTATASAAALAAFYRRIPVAHVEAGLRSDDLGNPFPEEMNRRIVALAADLHFAPGAAARDALLAERVSPGRIVVTGNTAIDALQFLGPRPRPATDPLAGLDCDRGRLVLVTSHRRESWGSELSEICLALRDIVTRFPDVHVVFPVHLNPNVRQTVHRLLSDTSRIHLVEPLDYLAFANVMSRCYLILTDSGGIQEEAPTFRAPVLVLRTVTERPQACEAGLARLVGTSRERIVAETARLLTDVSAHRRMTTGANPFGDGQASTRIADAIGRWAAGADVLLPESHQFAPEIGEPIYACA